MRIFVTGGTGFIGRHVVKVLKDRGDTLLVLSRQPMADVNFVPGDLSDIANWKGEAERFQPDAAIHLAWEGLPNYDARTSVRNLNYGLNLITMLAEIGCKSVICTGSCWEYGQQSGKVSEDTAVKPHNAFTAAKNALHWVGREIADEHGMNFTWTRLFYVYGSGQRKSSLIPYIIDSVKTGKKPELKTPLARNDFIYVEDVAGAISAIVKKLPEYAVYNIGSGSSTSVRQIVETVCDKFGFPYDSSEPNNLTGSPAVDFWADISRIKSDTSWQPEAGIKEGIQKTIESYLNSKG